MIYDVLGEYKKYLAQSLSKATVQTYGNRLEWLLKDQSILDIENGFDIQPVLQSLQRIKYKNEFSQYKNALLYFLQFKNIPLSEEQSMLIKSYEENTKKKYRKQTVIDYESIKNKITHIRNKKLKLSYQTMLSTGLRVFELSQIKKNDCIINSDNLRISFIGKGGKKETVKILKQDDIKIFDELMDYINKLESNDRLFYSVNYLQQQAEELGFHCHDLRRICAKLEYKKTKSKARVKSKLRHASIKNTNRYLKSKIKGV